MARIKRAFGAGLLMALAGVSLCAASEPRITHFGLWLAIDDQKQAVEGIAEFHYLATGAAADTFSFVTRDLQISSIDAEPGAGRSFETRSDRLEITVGGSRAGTASDLRIRYRAQPRQGLYFHRTLTATGVPVEQVWQFEAWEYWMPRPSDPDQLMSWDFEAEVRPDWQVVSNGDLVFVEAAGARRLFHWRQSQRARLEGFTFAAGNFQKFEQQAGGRRIANYVPAGVADAATITRSFGRVPQMLDLFSREFGAYRFRDFRQVVLWDYHPQGTEHLGLSCLSENKLIDELARRDADDYIVAHELAHNWWAVLVAPKSPAHVWLSEGFAVYFGNQFFEAADDRDEFQYRLRRRLQLYLDEDRQYRRVLVSDDPVPGELDEHIYSKGAYILHMLRRYLGDERFFEALRRYARQYAFARADSADFQHAMEKASGEKLDWYFQQWLYSKGYPKLKVEQHWDEAARTLTLHVAQVQDASAGTYRLPVQIHAVSNAGAETYDEVLQKRSETRVYHLKGRLRYVRFDADNRLLATVDFPRPAADLIAQLDNATDASGRIEAVEAMATVPEQAVGVALQRSLHSDPFYGVRSAAALALSRRSAESAPILLQALHDESDSRVLQNIVAALEPFAARADVQQALKRAAVVQPSPYVQARALLALARVKADGASDLLTQALAENAHRDVVRVAAFQGFAILDDRRAVPAIMAYLHSDRATRFGREAAVEALGQLAHGDAEAMALLQRLRLEDFWPGVRANAARVLQAQQRTK